MKCQLVRDQNRETHRLQVVEQQLELSVVLRVGSLKLRHEELRVLRLQLVLHEADLRVQLLPCSALMQRRRVQLAHTALLYNNINEFSVSVHIMQLSVCVCE